MGAVAGEEEGGADDGGGASKRRGGGGWRVGGGRGLNGGGQIGRNPEMVDEFPSAVVFEGAFAAPVEGKGETDHQAVEKVKGRAVGRVVEVAGGDGEGAGVTAMGRERFAAGEVGGVGILRRERVGEAARALG